MNTLYDTDFLAWANEQAALLRAGRLDELDVLNIAEEIEDVGKNVQHELASRLAVLLAHLLKWRFQKDKRSFSWQNTIEEQRRRIVRSLRKVPSLKHTLADTEWLDDVWRDAVQAAEYETHRQDLPKVWIWSLDEVLDANFYPD